MAFPPPQVAAAAGLVLAFTLAAPAGAQEAEPPYEVTSVRLRYGMALRNGDQQDLGPGLQYSGLTPNDFALSARYWLSRQLGAGLFAQREGFALFTTDGTAARVSGGSLLRLSGGPSGRLHLGPLSLEALLGWQMAELPDFGNSAQVNAAFSAITRHSVLGAVRASVALPFADARLEARGEYLLPLLVSSPGATSSGLSAGASLVVPLGASGAFQYAVVADYQYVRDAVVAGPSGEPTLSIAQALQRAGVALELVMLDREPPPRFGTVLVRAVDADSGQPLAGAEVALTVAGRGVSARPGAAGSFIALGVVPGPVVARVTAGGYLPAEGQATVVAGQEAAIDVKVKKEPPKVGTLLVTLLDKVSGQPIAGATVKVRGVEKQTSGQGTVTFDNLSPGPAPVEASVPDYRPVSEVASIVALKTAELPFSLVKARAAVLATITGQVRSSAGGRPVPASLEIPEAKVKTRATSSTGGFTIRIPGGTYSLIISSKGYITQSKTVTVKDGDQAIFNVDLHPLRPSR